MVTSGYMLGMSLGMSSSILLQYELSPDMVLEFALSEIPSRCVSDVHLSFCFDILTVSFSVV